jgi:hypothetical protein
MRVKTISLTSGSNGAARLAMFSFTSVENEMEKSVAQKAQKAVGRLGQLERIVVPMRERLGHTTICPVQFAFGMGDCDPAVAMMLVVTGIGGKVVGRPGV